jgi:hypothetical protein
LLFLILNGCVDRLNVDIPENETKLLVYGLITQLPGPYEVQLSYSSDLDKKTKTIERERGASVWIVDSKGLSERLTEISAGIYRTSASGIQGEPGRSYHIKIFTEDGREYESIPQLLKEATDIENVYSEFERDGVTVEDDGSTRDAFNIYIDGKGNETNNLLRWRWTGIYVGRTYPELHDTLYPRARSPVPYPLPCSGYILSGGTLVQVGECTCCICWSHNQSTTAIVSKNTYVNDNTFRKVNLGKVAVTSMHFYERYFVEAEQLTLSEDSYIFWKLMEAQQQAIGSIFQPNSVRIKGNVRSLSDPNETVLGIFEASAITRKSVFIERDQIPYDVPPVSPIGEDCRRLLKNATTTKPLFW